MRIWRGRWSARRAEEDSREGEVVDCEVHGPERGCGDYADCAGDLDDCGWVHGGWMEVRVFNSLRIDK